MTTEKLRAKFCEDLENLLECPICMSIPREYVYQCIQGHHICKDCKGRLLRCPMCKESSFTRSLLAENLCSKLDEITLSLMDLGDKSNKVPILDRVSRETQTDKSSPALPIKSINNHTGSYPCRIDSCCDEYTYERMIMHLTTSHPLIFSEIINKGPVYEYTLLFTFIVPMTVDRAIHIPSMGTFFVKLAVDKNGTFIGFLMIVHNKHIAKKHTYQMKISSYLGHESSTITRAVFSCRSPLKLPGRNITIPYLKMKKMIDSNRKLLCTVVLTRQP